MCDWLKERKWRILAIFGLFEVSVLLNSCMCLFQCLYRKHCVKCADRAYVWVANAEIQQTLPAALFPKVNDWLWPESLRHCYEANLEILHSWSVQSRRANVTDSWTGEWSKALPKVNWVWPDRVWTFQDGCVCVYTEVMSKITSSWYVTKT